MRYRTQEELPYVTGAKQQERYRNVMPYLHSFYAAWSCVELFKLAKVYSSVNTARDLPAIAHKLFEGSTEVAEAFQAFVDKTIFQIEGLTRDNLEQKLYEVIRDIQFGKNPRPRGLAKWIIWFYMVKAVKDTELRRYGAADEWDYEHIYPMRPRKDCYALEKEYEADIHRIGNCIPIGEGPNRTAKNKRPKEKMAVWREHFMHPWQQQVNDVIEGNIKDGKEQEWGGPDIRTRSESLAKELSAFIAKKVLLPISNDMQSVN